MVPKFTEAQVSKTVSVYLSDARKRKSTPINTDFKKRVVIESDSE
jgi:hypothetical protein